MDASACGGCMLIVMALVFLAFVKRLFPPRWSDRMLEEYDSKREMGPG